MKDFRVNAADIQYLLNFVNTDMTDEEIEDVMCQVLEEESQVNED